ncbi:MAG: hypothetical protein WC867_05660 [Candidatus Pacearchaeota archaeon]|jgi:hypothetical protein
MKNKEFKEFKEFTIRKKIASQGKNSIIVIPKLLQNELKPRTIVEINIKILEENNDESG